MTPALVPRPALLPTSDDRRLFLVTAPAGFGKTTLLRQWASTRDAAWLTLTPDHDDPDVLREALAEVRAAALALDDVHTVTHPDARVVLDQLCDTPSIRLALASRESPALPSLNRHRVRQTLLEHRSESLLFRGDALAALADALALPLSAQGLAALAQATGGWAGAVVLASQWLRSLPQESWPNALGNLAATDSALHDYLAHEVLQALPPGLRTFALESSVLPQLPEGPEARALERRRLLVPIRTFHPLLRAFLQTRLREALGAEGYRAHCRALADAAPDFATAATLWVEAQAWDALADAAEARLPIELAWWRYRPLLARLPNAVLDERPELLRVLARGDIRAGRVGSAAGWLERAEAAFHTRHDLAGAASCRLDQALLLRGQGRLADAAALLDAVEAQPETLPATLRCRLLSDQGVRYLHDPVDLERAGRLLDEAAAWADASGDPVQAATARINRALGPDFYLGRFDRMETTARMLEADAGYALEAEDRMFVARIRAFAGLALGAPETEALLENAICNAAEAEFPATLENALLALWHAERGAEAPARAALERAGDEPTAHLARAYLAATRRTADAVEAHAGTALAALSSEPERAVAWNDAASAAQRAGMTDTALRWAEAARTIAETLKMPFEALRAHAVLAVRSPESLAACLRLAEGSYRTYLLHRLRERAPEMLARALAHDIERERALELLHALGIPALTVRLFGAVRVERNGQPIVWPRPRTRTLFVRLLLDEGRAVPVERILADLWPELEPEKARQNYHVHCSHLRKTLPEVHLEQSRETIRLSLPAAAWRDDRAPEGGDDEYLAEFLYDDWTTAARARRRV